MERYLLHRRKINQIIALLLPVKADLLYVLDIHIVGEIEGGAAWVTVLLRHPIPLLSV